VTHVTVSSRSESIHFCPDDVRTIVLSFLHNMVDISVTILYKMKTLK